MGCPASRMSIEKLGSDVRHEMSDQQWEGIVFHELVLKAWEGGVEPEVYLGQSLCIDDIPVTAEMVACANDVVSYLRAKVSEGYTVALEVEAIIPGAIQSVGRIDAKLTRSDHVIVGEFKYGRKLVSMDTWQLKMALINARITHRCASYGTLIYQPRSSCTVWREATVTDDEVQVYGRELHLLITQLVSGELPYVTGDHCYKCPFMTRCPAYDTVVMNAVEFATFDGPIDVDLSQRYQLTVGYLKRLEAYRDALAAHVEAILNEGGRLPGLGIAPGRSSLKWVDEAKAKVALKCIYGVDITDNRVMSPAAVETTFGIKVRKDQMLVHKVPGKPVIKIIDESKLIEEAFGDD